MCLPPSEWKAPHFLCRRIGAMYHFFFRWFSKALQFLSRWKQALDQCLFIFAKKDMPVFMRNKNSLYFLCRRERHFTNRFFSLFMRISRFHKTRHVCLYDFAYFSSVWKKPLTIYPVETGLCTIFSFDVFRTPSNIFPAKTGFGSASINFAKKDVPVFMRNKKCLYSLSRSGKALENQ